MSDRKRILVFSILLMAGGTFCAAAIATTVFYRTAFEEAGAQLDAFAKVIVCT